MSLMIPYIGNEETSLKCFCRESCLGGIAPAFSLTLSLQELIQENVAKQKITISFEIKQVGRLQLLGQYEFFRNLPKTTEFFISNNLVGKAQSC